MLVFVADYPAEENRADGMAQRIAAIDSLFSSEPRLYLKIAFKHYFRPQARQAGSARVEYVNFFLHGPHIRRRLREASCIYVHTVFNFLRLLPYARQLDHKTMLDAHGVVPEEQAYLGRRGWSTIFEWVERRAVKHAHLLVVVTRKMGRHFLKKYPADLDAARIVSLPIFRPETVPEASETCARREGSAPKLIYAGSLLKWQNMDRVLEALARLTEIRLEVHTWLYVPKDGISTLQQQVCALGLESRVTVGWLPRDQLLREYAKMDAGFVLRDDSLLNQVAMPTKLFEYLAYGVVPIVWNPDVGDFLDLGYRYLTARDLLLPEKLEYSNLREMRSVNAGVVSRIEAETRGAIERLREFARGRGPVMPPAAA